MRIYYLGNFKPNRTEYWIAEALDKKAKVFRADMSQYELAEKMFEEIAIFKPDILLVGKIPKHSIFERVFNEVKIPRICWLFDLYFDLPPVFSRNPKDPQFSADLVLTTDGGHGKEWKKLGVNHKTLRQGIHAPEYKLLKRNKEIDILFVGSQSYKERIEMCNTLKEVYGDRFKIVGEHEEIRGMELNELLAKTKVVVGDSVDTPNYWSNRVYEITGRGGFLLFPETKGLEKEFVEDEIARFKRGDIRDLQEKIEYYLSNDYEREKIRHCGFRKCGEYTYDTRVKEFLKEVKCLIKKK